MTSPRVRMDVFAKRMARVLNTEVNVRADGRSASVTLPGFSYSDFNRAGWFTPWAILKQFDMPRHMIRDSAVVPMGIAGVIVAQHLKISPALYNRSALHSPTTLTMTDGFCGKTSLGYIFSFHNNESNEELARITRQFVFIDTEKRRPVEVPAAIKERFGPPIAEPLRVSPRTPPAGCYTMSLLVTHSDTDMLYHVNQSSYVRYCMDTAAQAVADGHLTSFRRDLFDIQVTDVIILHQGELFPGDICHVSVWQEGEMPERLYFRITKEKSPVAFVTVDMKLNESAKL